VQKLKLEIVDPPRRRHAVFEGASVLGSIYAKNDTYWFSKAQYAEEGAARLAGKVRSLVGSGH
jgi:actin-related protein 2